MKVKCKVIRRIYENNNFYIYGCAPIGNYPDLVLHPKYKNFSIKGELGYIVENQEYEFILKENSDKYGITYEVVSCPTIEQMDFSNLKYEESYNILYPNITTSRQAKTLLEVYPNFIQMIMEDKDDEIDVNKLFNIGEFRLNAYKRELKSKYKYYRMISSFADFNLTVEECKILERVYNDIPDVKKHLEENPYNVLCGRLGRSFKNTDKLILELFPKFRCTNQRAEYLCLWALEQSENEGHTRTNASNMAKICYQYAPECINLIKESCENSELIHYENETNNISSSFMYLAESFISDWIKDKLKNPIIWDIDWRKYKKTDEYEMTEEQLDLLRIACENNIGILGGSAGSGKSTSIKSFTNMLEDNNISYTMLTPTGISAKVLNKATQRPTSTIHRKIASDGDIDSQVVILDEFSMVSVDIFYLLLQKLSSYTKLFLVCDEAQLPSIGAGNILQNMIDSKLIPMTRLTKIFRYGVGALTTIATDIRNGKPYIGYDNIPLFSNAENSKDYQFIPINKNPFEQILNVYRNLTKKYSPNDIMILSPFNIGDFGSYKINEAIQDDYNPLFRYNDKQVFRKIGQYVVNFRVGDKVLNTRNNYTPLTYKMYLAEKNIKDDNFNDKEIFVENNCQIVNGDIGYIKSIEDDDSIVVQFDDCLIVYGKSDYKDLLLANCISVHKCQGSQAKAVINIIHPQHEKLLSKELLYVADTRAQELLIEIGNVQTINKSLKKIITNERNTWLGDMLKNEISI